MSSERKIRKHLCVQKVGEGGEWIQNLFLKVWAEINEKEYTE
jgi:hypothetical protein